MLRSVKPFGTHACEALIAHGRLQRPQGLKRYVLLWEVLFCVIFNLFVQ
mgnify:CR=1 FL=1